MPAMKPAETAPILLWVEDSSEDDVLKRMIRSLAGRAGILDLQDLERAVLERQKLQPPLLGNGVALPHARTPAVTEMVLAIGRCLESVPFGPDKVPVRLVFLYGVPAQCIGGYLNAVAHLTRLLKTPGTLDALLAAPDEASFRQHLQ